MSAEPARRPTGGVELVGVTKSFGSGRPRLTRALPLARFDGGGRRALDDVSFSIRPGERLGIIGPNGAGKSTLLRLIAGVTTPTTGAVVVDGTVASMIELGLGFHPELSGWENLRCSAALMGMPATERRRRAADIARFSGIEDHLDQPLRTFSSGMAARLGFAIATHVDADVLVVDEVLAVGDREFQHRCIERILELSAVGRTVVFVSHELPLVNLVCERALHLRDGRVVDDGAAAAVVERYLVRAPSRYRPSLDAPARFQRCELGAELLEPWQPIEILATIDVVDEHPELAIGTDLVHPSLAPDHIFHSHISRLEIDAPGRYRLAGRSAPYPGTSGHVRVITSLLDERSHRLADRAQADFRIESVVGQSQPLLAAEVSWRVERIDAGADRRGDVAVYRSPDPVATLHRVVKRYRAARTSDLRLAIPGAVGRRRTGTTVALDHVDLDVDRGRVLGVVGPNGAGKSTLLRLLAGITGPDEGTVTRRCARTIAILDFGMGFLPDLSGRENLALGAQLLGVPQPARRRVIDDAIDFAELGPAVDDHVRTYSSGMRARLSFSLARSADPELLLLDETLAVGDEDFRRRAAQSVRDLASAGTAVVFVSHDLALVEEVCERAVLLDDGRIVGDGAASEIVERTGGEGWARGHRDTGATVRLSNLTLARHHIGPGEHLELSGTATVEQSSDHLRMELSGRARADRRSAPPPDEALWRTVYIETVEPAGGMLSEAGAFTFHARIDRVAIEGDIDLVVSVVDERDGAVVSECWSAATVGRPPDTGVVGPMLSFDWTVSRMDPT